MEFLMEFFTGGTQSFLTGGIGTIFGAIGSYFQKRQELKQQIILKKLENEEYKLELNAGVKTLNLEKEIAESKSAVQLEKIASNNYVSSLEHDASFKNTSYWVANIRALVRPILTLILVVLFSVMALIGEINNNPHVVGLTSMMITWWFGSRIKTEFSK